jgi:hypothetical protein
MRPGERPRHRPAQARGDEQPDDRMTKAVTSRGRNSTDQVHKAAAKASRCCGVKADSMARFRKRCGVVP